MQMNNGDWVVCLWSDILLDLVCIWTCNPTNLEDSLDTFVLNCRQRCCIQYRMAVPTQVISHRQRCLSVTYHRIPMYEWLRVVCAEDIIASVRFLLLLFARTRIHSRLLLLLLLLHACQDGRLCVVEGDTALCSVRQKLICLSSRDHRSPLRMSAACSRKVVRSRMRVHRSCGEIGPGDIPPCSLARSVYGALSCRESRPVRLSVRLAADTITSQTQANYRPYMTAG